jgi:Bacterial PH domain
VPSLIAEGWHKAHRGAHYIQYVYFFLAAFTLARGLLLQRLTGGRRVTIDEQRLFVRTSVFRSRTVAWANVVGLTRTAKGLVLQLANGSSVSFDLRDPSASHPRSP